MLTTYIIGHQKPDTDSVVSAMALEYLYQQAICFGYSNPRAVIADPINGETAYLLDRFKVESPPVLSSLIKPQDQVVLVDHNEVSQRSTFFDQEQIVEIVDHHKANLNLSKPIFLTFKTWGSSSSIIYFLMKRSDVTPTKKLASLMLAAILSDTVGLKSPTTCEQDKKFAKELAKIAQIDDLNAFSLDIFKAKSDISKLSPTQIVKNDYKLFEFTQPTFIGQIETVEQERLLKEKKQELLAAMSEIKKTEKVDYLFLAVTDILKVNTKLVILSEDEQQIAQKAFGGSTEDNILDIGAKLSRKKEIAPAIESAMKK